MGQDFLDSGRKPGKSRPRPYFRTIRGGTVGAEEQRRAGPGMNVSEDVMTTSEL